MTQPDVLMNELDGGLGVLPPTGGELYAVVGVSSTGPFNTPSTFARVKDLVATFGDGPGVECAAHAIEKYGLKVVFVRTGQSVAGSYLDEVDPEDGTISAITKTGSGSAVFTDNSSDPLVAGSWKVLFLVGGTQGTGGIVYQVFKDNVSQLVAALGTAANFTIPGTQISIAISALGTIVAGDFITFTTTAPIAGSAGEVDYDGLQNAPSIDGTTHPQDDYEVRILFVTGGTRGIAGITYKTSLDDGRTYSEVTALGTATSIIVPGSGGVKVDLGAGTIDEDAFIAFPTVAPRWNGTELGTALDALKASLVTFRDVHVVGATDPDDFDVFDTAIAGWSTSGKFKSWIASTRLPVGSESEATYLSSLSAAYADKTTVIGMLCAGACEVVSSVSRRKYRRPASFVIGAKQASVDIHIDIAAIRLGALPCSIRDAEGNPKHHDESANPGLDDARFATLRTWEGRPGVYVNRPRLFSSETSDFQLYPHRLVMNVGRQTTRFELEEVLSEPLRVSKTTGRIIELEARTIESRLNAALGAKLPPSKASGVRFVLNRTDNLLATRELNYETRIIPLGYVERFRGDIGFENPALQIPAFA